MFCFKMTVFTLDEGDTTKEIDYAILHALLKGMYHLILCFSFTNATDKHE